MKILVVASSLDLTQPFSATPAWWQLLKAFYEIGVEILATTYQGPAIETLWWRALPNPVKREGDLFQKVRNAVARPTRKEVKTAKSGESLSDRLQRGLAQSIIAPRWKAFMDRTMKDHPNIDAVIFLTIPLNHVVGLAKYVQDKYHKPVLYYDGDLPASLPNFSGFSTGFKIYQGAECSEYTAFISNSQGAAETLEKMGAKAVHVVHYGADPGVFSNIEVQQDVDIFFYGHTREYREIWIDSMIAEASRQLATVTFAVRGRGLGDLGRANMLPYLSFSKLREYVCRSKINLCITRKAHTSVYASSTSRPFELASMASCIVANPYWGLENWFEPNKEIIIVNNGEEAIERYRWLLDHDSERRALGQAAQQRFLKEHTCRHRAKQIVDIIRSYQS